jgi:hypothetical protein
MVCRLGEPGPSAQAIKMTGCQPGLDRKTVRFTMEALKGRKVTT